jgi:hypothetical protein
VPELHPALRLPRIYGAVKNAPSAQLTQRLRHLKRLCFKIPDVELKSNWLRMPHEREKRYLKPYSLTEERLVTFVDHYYQLLNQAQLSLIGSVVNKLHMQETYEPPRSPWYAPTMAYECLMQRAALAVPGGDTLGVTIDDISGKTPKNTKYKEMVAAHHARLRKHGSRLQPHISFECLDSPARFVLSQHFELIQAADLVSYNIHRQFKDHGEDWEKPGPDGGNLPMYPYFERINEKFRMDENGRVQGFGIVKAPLLKQVRWTVVKEAKKKE